MSDLSKKPATKEQELTNEGILDLCDLMEMLGVW